MPTNWDVLKARFLGEKKMPPSIASVVTPIVQAIKQEDRSNPLQLVSGEVVLLDAANRYVVTNIDTFRRILNGVDMSFFEYTLVDNLDCTEGDGGKYRYLRMIPEKDQASGKVTHNVILSQYMWAEDPTGDELQMSEADCIIGFKRADWLAKTAFDLDDGADYEGYERSGGLTVPYAAVVSERDEGEKASKRNVRYWDFTKWDGQTLAIWFFELSLRDRVLTAMHGTLIDERSIRALRKVVLH